jgi:hypothetical protein
LQRARQAAINASQAKSTFLANMSHELRTPLNAITGFTRIVRRKGEGSLPQKQLENLDKVLVSADHLLNLINTILDIAKIEAGRMDVQHHAFSLPGAGRVGDWHHPAADETRCETGLLTFSPVWKPFILTQKRSSRSCST